MSSELIFIMTLRVPVTLLGFVALWYLWSARNLRGENWTKKMQNIWLSLVLFTVVTIEQNIELMLKQVFPTLALFFLAIVYVRVIYHSRDPGGYTVDKP